MNSGQPKSARVLSRIPLWIVDIRENVEFKRKKEDGEGKLFLMDNIISILRVTQIL